MSELPPPYREAEDDRVHRVAAALYAVSRESVGAYREVYVEDLLESCQWDEATDGKLADFLILLENMKFFPRNSREYPRYKFRPCVCECGDFIAPADEVVIRTCHICLGSQQEIDPSCGVCVRCKGTGSGEKSDWHSYIDGINDYDDAHIASAHRASGALPPCPRCKGKTRPAMDIAHRPCQKCNASGSVQVSRDVPGGPWECFKSPNCPGHFVPPEPDPQPVGPPPPDFPPDHLPAQFNELPSLVRRFGRIVYNLGTKSRGTYGKIRIDEVSQALGGWDYGANGSISSFCAGYRKVFGSRSPLVWPNVCLCGEGELVGYDSSGRKVRNADAADEFACARCKVSGELQ